MTTTALPTSALPTSAPPVAARTITAPPPPVPATVAAPAEAPARALPVELIDGPGGRLYLLPFAPLTPDDCEALSVLLAARAAAVRRKESATPQPE
ncbi:hypothetical protein [Microbispora sp. CSR-4]|uniref:hypothetical protein n=1 Tax=Microbispora sp. CSR-4 TaxID=2592813 RepID=UPI0011C93975|nr:hypothetical protein [Microbispora sp. CSR-4]